MLLLCLTALAQQPASDVSFDSLKFLLGRWVGEGSSEVGDGSGYFSFETALQGKAMVRKNHAEYPATKERPAYAHDDLMIVYVDLGTKRLCGFYTDNEGHVINYAISISSDRKSVVFLSEAQAASPRYRLTYTVMQPDKMAITLEVAAPGKPDQFQKIVEGRVRKSSS